MNPAQLVAEIRKFVGNDHPLSSYVLGYIIGVMADDPEITVKAALESFLKRTHKK